MLARIISRISHLVSSTSCLSQTLTEKVAFTVNRYNTQLHIGIPKGTSIYLKAKTWLSRDNTIPLGHLPNRNQHIEFSFHPTEKKI